MRKIRNTGKLIDVSGRLDTLVERLRRLRETAAEGSEAFAGDVMRQDAAVRNLRTSVEALLDMGSHIIAREGLGTPTSQVYLILDSDLSDLETFIAAIVKRYFPESG